MVKCLSALLDFCFIARRNALTTDDLDDLQDALTRFHHHRKVFICTAGVNGDQISLGNMLSHTISVLYDFLALRMDCAHQLPNPNILRLLRSHGDVRADTMPSNRCW